MLSQLLSVLNFILGRTDRWRAESQEQRARVAAYLNAVSDCLAGVAAEIRAERTPHAGCAELAEYARSVPEVVARVLGEEAPDLQRRLRGAAHSRAAAVGAPEDLQFVRQQAGVSEEIAGKVRALAVLLAVG